MFDRELPAIAGVVRLGIITAHRRAGDGTFIFLITLACRLPIRNRQYLAIIHVLCKTWSYTAFHGSGLEFRKQNWFNDPIVFSDLFFI
jgi:hypothetical protein